MSPAAPAPEDALLLRAVLLPGAAGVTAGREWLTAVDLDAVGPDQQRVLPLLYRTLLDAGATGLPPRLKGVYRHSWARNTVRARGVADVVRSLETAGVPSMVVKGMALVEYYGDRWGARDMYDADLLVPTRDASRAVDALLAAGWEPHAGATATTLRARLFSGRAGWPFVHGDLELDLHWHLFNTSLGIRADNDVWSAAERFVLDDTTMLRPHPADLVLHACEQGAVDAGAARLVSAADVATITTHVGVDCIGVRLAEQARRHSLLGRTHDFLAFVADCAQSTTVDTLRRQLAMTRPRRVERGLARASRHPDGRRSDLWSSARRHGGGRTGLGAIVRAIARERIEPGLARRRCSGSVYVLSGRRAWIGRMLRRLGGSWIVTPEAPSPSLATGEWLDFSDTRTVDRLGGPGWSFSEADGTWTDGAEARVVLPVAVPGDTDVVVTFEAVPFCVAASPKRSVELRANDRVLRELRFDGATFVPEPTSVRVGADLLREGEPLELGFVVDHPVVPATLGVSSDPRRVGLKLLRLRVDPVDALPSRP